MTKSTRDGRTIDFDPTEPFKGLCKFVEWWTEFERTRCQEIDATWSVNADFMLIFRFQHGVSKFQYALDLKDRYIPKALLEIEIGLMKLLAAPKPCL